MCEHPAVVESTDAGLRTSSLRAQTKNAPVVTHTVPSTLVLTFVKDVTLTDFQPSIIDLLLPTAKFFQHALRTNSRFKGVVKDVMLDHVKTTTEEDKSLSVSFETKIVLLDGAKAMQQDATHALASASWNEFITKYVRHQSRGNSLLQEMVKVKFRGVGRGSN